MAKTLAVGCAVMLGLVAFLLYRGSGPEPVAPGGERPTEDARRDAALEALSRRVDLLSAGRHEDGPPDDRLEALAARVEALEARIAKVEAASPAGVAEAKPDYSGLDDEGLAIRARSASGRRDYGEAAALWREVLARDPEKEVRSEALMQLGFACRMLKDRESELKAFRALVELHGEDTSEGLTAVFHVGWCRASQGHNEEAQELMERVATSEISNPHMRKWARYWSADYAVRVNDHAYARATLERLVEDYAESKDQNDQALLRYAKRKLAELDG
ncbi:MAG: tetratricopeptide repeat protein [Planctomycetota bacterium]|jgi:tetratricopeptide (TPR) repeat protein